jgi:intein-encoded DNA endonuclease-like protein
MTSHIFNFKKRKVGGIWFFKLGRLNLSFCVSRAFIEAEANPEISVSQRSVADRRQALCCR